MVELTTTRVVASPSTTLPAAGAPVPALRQQ
jgi:hypothetical protein